MRSSRVGPTVKSISDFVRLELAMYTTESIIIKHGNCLVFTKFSTKLNQYEVRVIKAFRKNK